jgi:hypothetical protein
MFFHRLPPDGTDRTTYVLGCGSEAVVVDPGPDVTRPEQVAAAEGARIRYVLETKAGDPRSRDLLAGRAGAVALIPSGSRGHRAATIAPGAALRIGDVRIVPCAVDGSADMLAYSITDVTNPATAVVLLGQVPQPVAQPVAA